MSKTYYNLFTKCSRVDCGAYVRAIDKRYEKKDNRLWSIIDFECENCGTKCSHKDLIYCEKYGWFGTELLVRENV